MEPGGLNVGLVVDCRRKWFGGPLRQGITKDLVLLSLTHQGIAISSCTSDSRRLYGSQGVRHLALLEEPVPIMLTEEVDVELHLWLAGLAEHCPRGFDAEGNQIRIVEATGEV